MNRAEMLKAVGEAHLAWSLRNGDDVPYNPAHEAPHDGKNTDLAANQADRSASAEIDDPLNEKIKALIAQVEP